METRNEEKIRIEKIIAELRDDLATMYSDKEDLECQISDKENKIKDWEKRIQSDPVELKRVRYLQENNIQCRCCTKYKECTIDLQPNNKKEKLESCNHFSLVVLSRQCNFRKYDLNKHTFFCEYSEENVKKQLVCLPGSCIIRASEEYQNWKKI